MKTLLMIATALVLGGCMTQVDPGFAPAGDSGNSCDEPPVCTAYVQCAETPPGCPMYNDAGPDPVRYFCCAQ